MKLFINIMTVCFLIVGTLMAAISVIGVSGIEPFKINNSDSLPQGIYIRTFGPIQRGSIVYFTLPDAMREYIGHWPQWLAWFDDGRGLLKPVVAITGDEICRTPEGIFSARGATLGMAPPNRPDAPPMPSWTGCKRLDAREIAVFSSRIPDSLDSRLFGAINTDQVRVYRPLWVK